MAVFVYDDWLERFIEAGNFVFEWDRGNRTKNWIRHGITTEESEEVFRGGTALPLGVQVDPLADEDRFAVLGESALASRSLWFSLFGRAPFG